MPRDFGFLPTDGRQRLRIRRLAIASASSLLVVGVLFVFAWIGAIELRVAIVASSVIAALIVFFYGWFRSGLNLRLEDPSLTTEQIGSAILLLAYVMHAAPQLRNALNVLYLMPLMFGLFRLGTGRLMVLAGLALAADALGVWASYRADLSYDLRSACMQLAVLAVMLPWFAVVGGYTNRLRRRLSDSNRSLAGDVGRIEQLALRDVLTGTFNRRHLDDVLPLATSRAVRLGVPLSLCMFDLDDFKSVNDTFGHPAGDAVLKHFATLAGAGLRSPDILGRYGGEEFLLVLPDTTLENARIVAERIRSRVATATFPGVPANKRITVTIGIAELNADDSTAELIARVDAALYRGKAAGRDRVTAG